MSEDSKTEPTPEVQRVFDAIQNKEMATARDALLNNPNISPNAVDKFGMSLLQQAAFKGSVDLCKLLLEQGAHVNDTRHEASYTALMFGALSGSGDVVRLLLDAGAEPDATNKIGRTAHELATFTGQHEAVGVLNNYLGPENVSIYTKPRGSESEPRLPSHLAPPMQALVRTTNVHPVNLIWFLIDNPTLNLEHSKDHIPQPGKLFTRYFWVTVFSLMGFSARHVVLRLPESAVQLVISLTTAHLDVKS